MKKDRVGGIELTFERRLQGGLHDLWVPRGRCDHCGKLIDQRNGLVLWDGSEDVVSIRDLIVVHQGRCEQLLCQSRGWPTNSQDLHEFLRLLDSAGAQQVAAQHWEGPPSFRRWLLRQCHRNDPIGDLARDFHAEVGGNYGRLGHVPPRRITPRTLRRHVEEAGGSDGAVEACERAGIEWEAVCTLERVRRS